ncbi:MAG TPA: amidohydrolase family protein [Dehalococcoidia bacterium]
MPRAIDVHIHPPNAPGTPPSPFDEAMRAYFRSGPPPADADEMAAYYQERDILGVLLASDWESTTGIPPVTNDYVAGIVRRYPRQFIGFCSVDPWKGRKAVDEVRRAAEELGLRGVKFHPTLQQFEVNDRRFHPLWAACAELRLPVLIHTGMTGIGAGMPGGGGLKTRYCAPIPYIDDLAAEFPELTIIMAHPAFPWVDEQLAVLLHKPNVYMDLSGYSPKYFQPQLVQYANTLLQDRMLFGSDYPSITPDRWLADFAEAPFRDEVRDKILRENAARLLGLPL